MKILIASDLHGDASAVRALLAAREREGAAQTVLLGDLLYHGPRNDLPAGYAPKEVIAALTALTPPPLCVRGNCDAEVDQMVLPFPILADYAWFVWDGLRVFATHGHHAGPDNPPAAPFDLLLSGHTHLPMLERRADGRVYANPGSVAIPKGGNPPTYLLYEDGTLFLRRLADGEVLSTLALRP